MAGLAVALVLVAGVVGLPRLWSGRRQASRQRGRWRGRPEPEADAQRTPAPQPNRRPPAPDAPVAPPPTEPAPDGWRTEYYRDISFQVPASWGYAVPPQSDWCADEPRGRTAGRPAPTVRLAGQRPPGPVASAARPRPASLLTEHVEALAPGPAVDYVEGAVRQGDWWVVTRFAGSAVLVVTTKDQARAEQILDSAQVEPEDAPCLAASPVAGPSAPGRTMAPTWPAVRSRRGGALPVRARADPADAELPRLRAAARLAGSQAQALVTDLAAAPVNDSSCDPAPLDGRPELAVLVRVATGGRTYDVHVTAPAVRTGAGMAGGIDDGTTRAAADPRPADCCSPRRSPSGQRRGRRPQLPGLMRLHPFLPSAPWSIPAVVATGSGLG